MDDFVPFDQRPEWKDVTPIPQDDGPNPVVPIAYTKKFSQTMDYFRAILKAKEISQRALDLTTEVIELNPANYTAWYYRRLCLFGLGSDLSKELQHLNQVIEDNQKNYQVWYHRSVVLEKYGKADEKELQFIESILAEDAKNYHAWAHRQWVVKHFDMWSHELAYLDKLIAADFRNNSAWNHRFFVIKSTKGITPEGTQTSHFQDLDLDDQVRLDEIHYAFTYINKAPNNESPWNYAYGIASYKNGSVGAMQKLEELSSNLLARAPVNIHAHWVLLECHLFQAARMPESRSQRYQAAGTLADALVKLDSIREKYWQFRKMQIEQDLTIST
jgi:protein farnesyltransferase/geranylgeranyltransferase type-1 subunit alpha